MQRRRRTSKSKRRGCRTGTVRYRDAAEAKAALARVRNGDTRAKTPARYFRCDLCKGFHLTAQADKFDPTRGAYR